jgi:hypothetical protein
METDSNAFSANFRLGGLYDSRVGSASGGGDEGSDRALAATLNAGWQAPMTGDFGFRMDYGGYADFHDDFDAYDVIDQSISLEPQYTSGAATFSLPVGFNYAMEDDNTDYVRYSLSPTITYLIPGTRQAVAVYGIGARIDDRDHSPLDEDGESLGAGCAYVLFFQGSSRIRFSLDYQNTRYDAEVIEYETASLSLDRRKDDTLVAGVDVQYQFTEIFGVYAVYSYIHSHSNVDLYDYDRNIVEAGLALKF